jgi:hypothetical protein
MADGICGFPRYPTAPWGYSWTVIVCKSVGIDAAVAYAKAGITQWEDKSAFCQIGADYIFVGNS